MIAALGAATLIPAVSQADEDLYFGPQVGLYFPASSELRDALGDTWFSFGASFIRDTHMPDRRWAHDWQVLSRRDKGNKLFIFTGSFGYVASLGDPEDNFEPYAALRAGLSYMDYSIDLAGDYKSSKRLGFNANAALGVNLNRRVNIELRYDLFSQQDELTFDGLSLAVKVGLVRF